MKQIGVTAGTADVQKTVLLGTARILKGSWNLRLLTGCGWISTVFFSIVLLCVSSVIIVGVIITTITIIIIIIIIIITITIKSNFWVKK